MAKTLSQVSTIEFMSCILVKQDGPIEFSYGLVFSQGYFDNCTNSFLGAKKNEIVNTL